VKNNGPLVFALAICCVVPGCRGSASTDAPSVAVQHDVAQRFAGAILHGDAAAAVALQEDPEDAGLSSIATRAAAMWATDHGTIRGSGKRSGERWIFAFAGTHTHRDGRFERVRGHILVVLTASSNRARVAYFAVRNDAIRFSTHHDSVLLPSDR
jgi:hypothetical protein